MPTMRGIHAALSPSTFLPRCVMNATSENQPTLPSITPTVNATPTVGDADGIWFDRITTHVTIAAGLSTTSASPTVKPDHRCRRASRVTTESDAAGSSVTGAAGATG